MKEPYPRLLAKAERCINEQRYRQRPVVKKFVRRQIEREGFDYFKLMQEEAKLDPRNGRHVEMYARKVADVVDKLVSEAEGFLHIGGGRWVHDEYATLDDRQKNWRLCFRSKLQDEAALERKAYVFEEAAKEVGAVTQIVRNEIGEVIDVLYRLAA